MLTVRRILRFVSSGCSRGPEIVGGGRENGAVTTVEEERTQARIDGLLQVLRDAESDFRRSYARVLDLVAELDAERAGAVTGFGTTARLLVGALSLTKGEAKAGAEQAVLLAPHRSLIGDVLPPMLPATATELAAGTIGPAHVRVITTTMRRIPPSTHPGTAAAAEQTLATAARRFDPTALSRIGERLLAHLDPDGKAPADEPETMRELQVRTDSDGVVSAAQPSPVRHSITRGWRPHKRG